MTSRPWVVLLIPPGNIDVGTREVEHWNNVLPVLSFALMQGVTRKNNNEELCEVIVQWHSQLLSSDCDVNVKMANDNKTKAFFPCMYTTAVTLK